MFPTLDENNIISIIFGFSLKVLKANRYIESFNVLMKEVRSLGIDIDLVADVEEPN